MNSGSIYDVIIIGGGIAGLSLAVLLGRQHYKVLVLEKESYPKHKVCGEYVSMESKPFLEGLGLGISNMQLPVITKLQVTDTRGNEVSATLPQGGFGISRYKLDAALAELVKGSGATLITKTKAEDVKWANGLFIVKAKDRSYVARVVCGTWGKRSNIDVKWQRPFIKEKNRVLNNYVAVKYHVNYPWQKDLVALHNFKNGYCGVSQVEDSKVCLCYLTTAKALRSSGNDIKKLEHERVVQNPWLRKIFNEAEFLYESPLAISQISFERKAQVEEHVLLLGDAAGSITPLCGNGMSMAMRAAKISAALINDFLNGNISREAMEKSYITQWTSVFSKRLFMGRFIQSNFGKETSTTMLLKVANALPFVKQALIKGTSGEAF